jgi:5-methylcytosine-specific restriction endonuclease McrA
LEFKVSDTLVLNADGIPVSYLPLSAIQWKEAITYLWLDKVTVLDWYDDWVVRSAHWETRVPAVIMLKDMMRRGRTPRFSKTNVYIRDLYTCQYCNTQHIRKELTLDHVIPISRGGRTNWENIVAACGPCNVQKGNKTVMKPLIKPYKPDYWDLVSKRKQLDIAVKHDSWKTYL